MQTELDIQYPELGIEILGVNEVGHELGNEDMCDGRDLPWLQDTSADNWWGEFRPIYRDVIILDGEGVVAGIYNLTEKPVTEDANFVELKAMLVEMAEAD